MSGLLLPGQLESEGNDDGLLKPGQLPGNTGGEIGVTDSRLWSGVGKAISPMVQKAGLGIIGAAVSGPTDLEVIDALEANPTDRNTLAKRWFNRPYEDLVREKQAGAQPKQVVATAARAMDQEIEEALQPGQLTPAARQVAGAAQSVAMNAPGLVASFALRSPAPAMALAGVQQAGETIATGMAAGAEEGATLRAGVGTGAVEAGLEGISLGFSGILTKGAKNRILKFIIGEEATELPTTFLQETIEKVELRPEETWGEFAPRLKQALIDTAIQTPLAAGAQGMLVRGLQKLDKIKDPNKKVEDDLSEKEKELLDTIRSVRAGEELARMGQPAPDISGEIAKVQRLLGERAGEEIIGAGNATLQAPETPVPPPAPSAPPERVQSLIDSINATLSENITEADVESQSVKAKAAETIATAAEQVAEKAVAPAENPQGELALQNDSAKDVGQSIKATLNASNYPNPNDQISRDQLPVVAGPAELVGKRAKDVSGPVTVAVGEATEDRPQAYLEAIQETLEKWRAKYLPNSTVMVMNQSLGIASANGNHRVLENGVHVIVPPPLRRFEELGPGRFNAKTQSGAFYSLTHEFGHAILYERLFDNPVLGMLIRDASKQGTIPEELIVQARPEIQDLLREYNVAREGLTSGAWTAQDYLDKWAGVQKAQKKTFIEDLGLMRMQSGLQVLQHIAERAGGQLLVMKAKKQGRLDKSFEQALFQEREEALNSLLSLDEYLAEQTTRYAYVKHWEKGSALYKKSLLKAAIDSIREFFVEAKKEGVIAPGVKFQEWMDGLTKSGQLAETAPKPEKAKGKKIPTSKTVKAKKAAPPPVVEAPAPPPVGESIDAKKRLTGVLGSLVRNGTFERGDPQYKQIADLIKHGEYQEAVELMQPFVEKTIKYSLGDLPEVEGVRVVDGTAFVQEIQLQPTSGDGVSSWSASLPTPLTPGWLQRAGGADREFKWGFEGTGIGVDQQGNAVGFTVDPAWQPLAFRSLNSKIIAEASGQWLKLGAKSPIFKGWFGNWEDPTVPSGIKNADGTPWVGFHMTQGVVRKGPKEEVPFWKFDRGDIGFHVGTLRAAHFRGFNMGSKERSALPGEERDALINERIREISRGLRQDNPQITAMQSDSLVMPLFVAVKNPLDVGTEDAEMWSSPYAMLYTLEKVSELGMTPEEFKLLDEAVGRVVRATEGNGKFASESMRTYERMEPLRQYLEAKGYDGLVYTNIWEGDKSVVAFRPNQVKSAYGNTGTFSDAPHVNWDLDFDTKREEGQAASNFLKKINPVYEHAPWRRALRHLQTKVLEMQQLAHLHPERPELGMFTAADNLYVRDKAAMQQVADRHTAKAESLTPEQQQQLWKAFEAEVVGDELWVTLQKDGKYWRAMPTARTLEELKKHGITLDTETGKELFQIWMETKQSLLDKLVDASEHLQSAIFHRYFNPEAKDPVAHQNMIVEKMREVAMRTALIVRKPFFPRGDFGNYVAWVEEAKSTGKGTQIVWRRAFEREEDWHNHVAYLQKAKKPGQEVKVKKISDTQYVMMGLPVDFVELAGIELGLSAQEQQILINIMQPVKSQAALSRFQLPGYGLSGSSSDWVRSYANFMLHTSNLVAKLKHRPHFRAAIREMTLSVKTAEAAGDTRMVRELKQYEEFMKQTYDYIMAPPNELHTLRMLVSLSYLGFNVKTALLNLYGAVTTWSDLAAKEGHAAGTARLMSAFKKSWNATTLTELNAPTKGRVMDPDTQQAYDRAIAEGVLAQSYAYHLAGVANAPSLNRMRFKHGQNMIKGAMDASMWVFRLTELATRRATFIAEYEIAKKQGLTSQEAYDAAVKATAILQNDFSYGNRPAFMRGTRTESGNPLIEGAVPIATIFMSFAQHMAFHTFGGYEIGLHRAAKQGGLQAKFGYTLRIWLLTLLLAGYEGLPGAENLLDLIDGLMKKLYGKSGRQATREFVREVGGDPVLLSHGLMHNLGGFDLSRSVGFGRVVPGTDAFARASETEGAKFFGNFALDMLGPFGGWVRTLLNFGFGTDSAVEAVSKGPGVVGGLASAYRWSQDGVRTPTGAKLTYDQRTGEIRDLTTTEIAGKALGFNPSIVAENREIRYAQLDAKLYWQTRRANLLDDYWEATRRKDGQALNEVKELITSHNERAKKRGHPELAITPKQLADSMKIRRKKMLQEERMGSATERRYRDLTSDIRQSFSSPEGSGNP